MSCRYVILADASPSQKNGLTYNAAWVEGAPLYDSVSLSYPLIILKLLSGIPYIPFASLDMNADGQINLPDALIGLQAVSGQR